MAAQLESIRTVALSRCGSTTDLCRRGPSHDGFGNEAGVLVDTVDDNNVEMAQKDGLRCNQIQSDSSRAPDSRQPESGWRLRRSDSVADSEEP